MHFARRVAKLILHAEALGYGITLNELYRAPETAALYAKQGRGTLNSLHCLKLAIDVNLFSGQQLHIKSEEYEELGEFWEGLSTEEVECCWGGRFKDRDGNPKPDGNHFSIEHEGRK